MDKVSISDGERNRGGSEAVYSKRIAEITSSHYRPLAEQVENSDFDLANLLPTGFPTIDKVLQGGIPRGLTFVGGYQQTGKTLFVENMLALEVNRNKPMVLFTPDETVVAVIRKLYAIITETPLEEVNNIKDSKHFTKFAEDELPNLGIAAENMRPEAMEHFIKGFTNHVGQPACVFYDYAEALKLGMQSSGFDAQAGWFKGRSKEDPWPWVVIHQARRPSRPGFLPSDLRFGGEAHAVTIIGSWRLANFTDELEMTDVEKELEKKYPSVHLVIAKNKMTGRTDAPTGQRFHIKPSSKMEVWEGEAVPLTPLATIKGIKSRLRDDDDDDAPEEYWKR